MGINGRTTGKEDVNSSILDVMMVYIETPKKCTKNRITYKFSKVAGNKDSVQS